MRSLPEGDQVMTNRVRIRITRHGENNYDVAMRVGKDRVKHKVSETHAQAMKNAQSYLDEVGGPDKAEIVDYSEKFCK